MMTVFYLVLFLLWQVCAATQPSVPASEDASVYKAQPTDLSSSDLKEGALTKQSLLRPMPSDDTVTISNDIEQQSGGGVNDCRIGRAVTGKNVRFQTVKVPGVAAGTTREFTRRVTEQDFVNYHSSSWKSFFLINFADCARTVSSRGMNAFSFEGSTCTGYVMTKFPCLCPSSLGRLILYIDLDSDLDETSYYESDEYTFYTVNSPRIYPDGAEDLQDCLAIATGNTLTGGSPFPLGVLHMDGKCDEQDYYQWNKFYDVVGGHEECAIKTIALPIVYKELLHYQYFVDLCGQTLPSPPLISSELNGGEGGPVLIYSHKGLGYFELEDATDECTVTIPVLGDGTQLHVRAYVHSLDGGPDNDCAEGDRLKIEGDGDDVMLCSIEPDRSVFNNDYSSATEDVVLTFTRDPTYTYSRSKGFYVRFWNQPPSAVAVTGEIYF